MVFKPFTQLNACLLLLFKAVLVEVLYTVVFGWCLSSHPRASEGYLLLWCWFFWLYTHFIILPFSNFMKTQVFHILIRPRNSLCKSLFFLKTPTDSFKNPNTTFILSGVSDMGKKGETREQDRTKPQPQKKKDRDAKRKDKKAARLERQKSR